MRFLAILFFAELFLSIKVGITIGFFWSVVWILLSMFIGITLLRLSPWAINLGMQSLNFGRLNLELFGSASIAYMTGAILLIIPGVLSDVIGLFLLFYVLYLQLFVTISAKDRYRNFKGDSDVIDTEIIDEPSSGDKFNRGGSSQSIYRK